MHTVHRMSPATNHASLDTGAIRFKRLWLAVVLLSVLIIVAFAGSSAYDAWRSYRYSILATDRELSNLANALAEQTAWSLQSVDLLLLDTARWYRSDSRQIPVEHRDDVLASRTAGVQQVRQVMIVDAQGNQRYGAASRRRVTMSPTARTSSRNAMERRRDCS